MSDLKVNSALGLSGVSVILTISNFLYTSNKIKSLEKSITDIEKNGKRLQEELDSTKVLFDKEFTKKTGRMDDQVKNLNASIDHLRNGLGEFKYLHQGQIALIKEALESLTMSDDDRRLVSKILRDLSIKQRKPQQQASVLKKPKKTVRFDNDDDEYEDVNGDADDEDEDSSSSRQASKPRPQQKQPARNDDDEDDDEEARKLDQLRKRRADRAESLKHL